MCEPTHSIVQYPDQDPDSGTPTGSKIEAVVGGFRDWFKKISSWFHLSVLGSGHSQAIVSTKIAERMLPIPTFYEGMWWDRTVRLDGFNYMGHRRTPEKEQEAKLALECAEEYSKRVVIGNLSMLRRFLDTSMRKSVRPEMYLRLYMDQLIVKEKRDQVNKRLQSVAKWTRPGELIKNHLEQIIKVMLGFTRKREFLCPAWADDTSLWTPLPDQKGLLVLPASS